MTRYRIKLEPEDGKTTSVTNLDMSEDEFPTNTSTNNNNYDNFMQPHPLLIDHIVERILSYASQENPASLLNFRLVSSIWNHYAVKALKKTYCLSFGGHKYNIGRFRAFITQLSSNPDKHLEHLQGPTLLRDINGNIISSNFNQEQEISEKSNEDDLSEITEVFPSTKNNFPFVRFRLYSDIFQESHKPVVLNFLRRCGPLAESLVIFKDINSDIEYTPDDLETFTTFPNLKEIGFSDRRRSEFSRDAKVNSFLYHVISCSMTTLTNISIKFPREPIYEIYEKEALIVNIFKGCSLPRLQTLKLDMSITDKVLGALSEARLKISTLHLSLGASMFSPQALKGLLACLAGTLTTLRLTDLYRRASIVVDLPPLWNLRHFEIHGLELPAYFITFPGFSYADKMPHLKSLCLNTWAPVKAWDVFLPEVEKEMKEDTSFLPRLQKSVEGVNSLSLAMNFDCPLATRRISMIFQNLRKLEMHFSRGSVAALQTVFQHMVNLEELKLNQSYLGEIATNCIDDVITGIDSDECRYILRKKTFKDSLIVKQQSSRKPSLENLKRLKKFDILSLRHRNIVTDVSAYLVFLKMPSLVVLDVGRSELSEMCLKDLATRFPQGRFQKYLNKKWNKGYDAASMYRNSIFTSICSIQ